ncbi:MAG: transcriptional repressor [Chitinispirillaceae bacterium]|nr:transcriptional repressor [Chitinispirillaceae bacterium]
MSYLRLTHSHPSADEIYRNLKQAIPHLSLGTVYRNLNTLIEQGLVQKLPLEDGIDRFEATIAQHYHLVCESCGTVKDFTMPHPVDINEQAEKLSRFTIKRHRIDFYGICEHCQTTNNHQSTVQGGPQ